MNEHPVLYSFRRCPYAIRARMALAYGGVTVELREVVLRHKPEAMLAVSPKATVPVLQLPDGEVLEESLDIMRWALGQSDPDDWLASDPPCGPGRGHSSEASGSETSCPGASGGQQDLIALNDGDFKHWLDRYKYADRFPEQPAAWYRERAEEFLRTLEGELEQAPWLCGQQPGFSDVAVFPFLRQFAMVDADWFEAAPYPRLREWLQRQLKSTLFRSVMQKYPPWEPGQAARIFPEATG